MLARVAYEFRPPEYFALTIFGLSMLASISAGGAVKNLIGGIFGVWLSTIGSERVTAIEIVWGYFFIIIYFFTTKTTFTIIKNFN